MITTLGIKHRQVTRTNKKASVTRAEDVIWGRVGGEGKSPLSFLSHLLLHPLLFTFSHVPPLLLHLILLTHSQASWLPFSHITPSFACQLWVVIFMPAVQMSKGRLRGEVSGQFSHGSLDSNPCLSNTAAKCIANEPSSDLTLFFFFF